MAINTAALIVAMLTVCAMFAGIVIAPRVRANARANNARKQRAQRIARAHARAMDEHAQYMAARSQRARDEYPFHNA